MFLEFAWNAWEKRKLGELVEIQNGYAFESKYFTEAPTKFVVVTPGSVLIGGGFRFGSGHFYDLNGPVPRDFVFKPGDLFLTLTDLTPSARLLGYSAFVPHDDNVYLHNQRLGKIESIGSSLSFIYYLTSTPSFHNAIVRGASGTTVKHSSKAKVLSYQSEIPFLSEQHQISSFLKKFDDLIAATQHKIDALEQAKKVLLQRLFDQSWRFKDYSDPWEKRKLGDLGSVAMNKRIYKDQTSDEGEIPFYKIGSFGKQADAFISRKLFNEYKKLYPFPKKGDILISASGSIGRTIVYNGEDAYFQDSNIIWIQHDNRLDNTFLHQLFNIIRWSGVEGTTIKRLYNKNILSTQILLPSVEEQRSIGNLLDNVDNLIAATQSRLSSLELLKKFLLQNLFI